MKKKALLWGTFIVVLSLTHFLPAHAQTNASQPPLRLALIGLTHTHVHWAFNSAQRGEMEIVGIVEPNQALALRYAEQYHYDTKKIYATSTELLRATKPEAVACFGTIAEHIKAVETYAPLGVHIMVEKPLAINNREARRMQQLAQKHGVHLMVNYETTWYPTIQKAQQMIGSDSLGDLVHLVIHDGHKGPKKIGINREFLDWLTDPKQNGGGAITDFGCYGANIATWFMRGQRPTTVTAITQQLQAENNPLVDDEATILLTYDNCKVTIMPSWNWPIGRKDMEVYCRKGAIYQDNKNNMRVRIATGYDSFTESKQTFPDFSTPYHDPFAYFAAIIRKKVTWQPFELSSLENNMIAQEILDAARKSVRTGKTVRLR
jgi:predicted dehydrogenase